MNAKHRTEQTSNHCESKDRNMILLDLDNTLIDHSGSEHKAAILFGKQYADAIIICDSIAWAGARNDMFADEADTIFSDYLDHYEASWQIFPDVLAFLEAHAEQYLAVLSDGAQKQQEAKLTNTGIRHYFQFVVTAESIGLSKPNP